MGELVLALMQLQTTRHRALARAIYSSTRINKSALTWRLNYRCTLVMLHSCAHAHTHECHSVWDVTHTRDACTCILYIYILYIYIGVSSPSGFGFEFEPESVHKKIRRKPLVQRF